MDAETQRNLAVAALIVTIVVAATAIVLVATYRIKNVVKVKAIGVDVFWDPECTVLVESIDWGLISPGDLKGTTVFIKSTKNANFTMTIIAEEWIPIEGEQFFTVDWNYTGEVLFPTDVIVTQITLYLDPFVANFTDFTFDIVIAATEV